MLPKTDAIWHARQTEAEAEVEVEVEVEAKIARSPGPTISCSIVDNQSTLLTPLFTHTHTLRLIAKRGQCDFAPP